jgi:hypothetical protein
MNAHEFQHLARLFDEAVSVGCIAQAAEVSSLLAHDRSPPRFLSDDGIGSLTFIRACLDRHPVEPDAAIPEEIDGLPILGVMGVGGSGVVYRARQLSPAREVAVKVLRPGLVTDHLSRRFAFEAEALGRLNHPGIAQIYGAGASGPAHDARLYLVMELVEGEPLTTYARRWDLSLSRRLTLFVDICDAVQHAHYNGVIHRDLKPANILVGRDGHPKIVDFGIARAAADPRATLEHTQPGALLGTLPYMSPEQIARDAGTLDSRTDVYSLGVVLYELLSGTLPFDLSGTSLAESARIICERDPRRLTDANPSMPPDLATIAAKALAKDPDRRYDSPQRLADDIRRFLENRPIEARPATAWYRARKFAARNRALTASLAAAAALLVGGSVGVTAFAVAALNAERRAERRVADVRQLARALLLVHDSIADATGTLEARRLIATTAVQRLDALVPDAADDPTLLLELAAGYTRLGDVLGNSIDSSNLGDFNGALQSYDKALALLQAAPDGEERDAALAHALEHRASMVRDRPDTHGAVADIERALAFRQSLAAGPEAGPEERRALHAALELRVAVARYAELSTNGLAAESASAYARDCEAASDAYAATIDPSERADPWRFARATSNPGLALRRDAEPGGELATWQEMPPVEPLRAKVQDLRRDALARPESAQSQHALFQGLMLLGVRLLLEADGADPERAAELGAEAAECYADAAAIVNNMRRFEPLYAGAHAHAFAAHAGRAEGLLLAGRLHDSLDQARHAAEIATHLTDAFPRRRAAELIVRILVRLERTEEALAAAREWLDLHGPDDSGPVQAAADLATLLLRVRPEDAQACVEAGALADRALLIMERSYAEGRTMPTGWLVLRDHLTAISEACAAGDRAAALKTALAPQSAP